jgi:hypothetical protein
MSFPGARSPTVDAHPWAQVRKNRGEFMQTGHELFVHGLNDMLDAEKQLTEALAENASDSSRADLKKAFDQHRKQTEGQIKRLEECFQLLSEEPEETECHGIRGLIAEKKAFVEEDPSEDLIDAFNVGAARGNVSLLRFANAAKDNIVGCAFSFPSLNGDKLLELEGEAIYSFGMKHGFIPHGNRIPEGRAFVNAVDSFSG